MTASVVSNVRVRLWKNAISTYGPMPACQTQSQRSLSPSCAHGLCFLLAAQSLHLGVTRGKLSITVPGVHWNPRTPELAECLQ